MSNMKPDSFDINVLHIDDINKSSNLKLFYYDYNMGFDELKIDLANKIAREFPNDYDNYQNVIDDPKMNLMLNNWICTIMALNAIEKSSDY